MSDRVQVSSTAFARVEQGSLASVKGVGAGVLEHRIERGARLPDRYRPRGRRAGNPFSSSNIRRCIDLEYTYSAAHRLSSGKRLADG